MVSVYLNDSGRSSNRGFSWVRTWFTRLGQGGAKWLLLALFVTGTAGSFWNLHQSQEQLSQNLPLQGTAIQLLTLQELRKVYAEDVVSRVQAYGIEAAHDYATKDRAIPLPATLTIELGKRVSESRPGASVRLYSDHPFPWRKDGGPQDDFEREALAALRRQPEQPYYRFEEFEGRPSLRYAVADRMQTACVTCHNSHRDSPKTDWQVGDVRGVLGFVRPLDEGVAQSHTARWVGLFITLTMAGLGLSGLGLTYFRLQRTAAFLGASESRTRAILDSALDCIITIDHEGNVLEFNPAAEKTFGYRRADLIGKRLADLIIPPAMREAHERGLRHYLATGESPILGKRIEMTALRADGTEFPVELAIDLVRQNGPPVFTGYLRDLTERRQAEAQLRRQEKQLIDLTSNASIGLHAVDPDGVIQWANRAELDMLGYSREDYVHHHISEFHTDESVIEEILHRLQAGASVKDCEARLRCKDGSIKHVLIDSDVLWEDGKFIQTRCFTRDITDRKRAEKALGERALLATLTADVALALTRSDNPRAILQHCSEAVVRHLDAAFARIWTLNEAEQVLELQASAGMYTHLDGPHSRVPVGQFKIGKIAQERKAHLTNNVIGDPRVGNQEWARQEGMVAFAGYPLIVGDRLVGVLAMFARKPLEQTALDALGIVADAIALGIERFQATQGLARAQEEKVMAEAASRAKNEFLSRMSHELRTPLNAILGFGQLLEMNELTDDQRECVGQINRGGKHLLRLINEVLDIARIEAGRMELSPEPVRVADAFQEVLDLVQPLGTQRDIQFHADRAGADGHHVLADNQKLKQVLLNLLSNAVKYNRDRGEVRLTCEAAEPGRLRLAVSDTGPGIAPEKLARLFVPFDRLGAEQTRVEGSGLGLALSKSLVELMGGTLTVTSAVGVGSRFCIELIQADCPQEQMLAEDEKTPEPAAVTAEARTVLYIEDNLDNLRLIQRILAYRPGLQLLTAMQGSLGIDLARQHRPDLILLDVHLPDLNGELVLRRLKEAPETRLIPVVVISADATASQIERLRAAGAHDYLTKPIEVPRFLKIVNDVLQRETPER